jgi:hypothetical protein
MPISFAFAQIEIMQSVSAYFGILTHANTHGLEEKLRHKLWEWLKEPSEQKRQAVVGLPVACPVTAKQFCRVAFCNPACTA